MARIIPSPIATAVLLSITLARPSVTLAQSRGTSPPQRVERRAPVKTPTPLTLRQVIESLSSLRNSSRVEDLISKAGVQFEATPAVVDILKQFGASPKLISMIPVPPPPPPPPQPPAPKVAGPLTIACEPGDCAVVIDEKYEGLTDQNRKTISGLRPGETTVQIFADGYEHLTRRIALEEGKPTEERFLLKRSLIVRQNSARASLVKAIASLGGIDGLVELGEIDVDATMQWTDNEGQVQDWPVTFNVRPGKNLIATFKTATGQCKVSILPQNTKQECKGELKNGGDKIAEQGASLFLSYQLQDVLHALLQRPLIASEQDDNRVESLDTKDSYVLTLGDDGSPTALIYRIANADSAIQVQYSNYSNVGKGRYPGQISVGRLGNTPVWVFTLKSIHSRIARNP